MGGHGRTDGRSRGAMRHHYEELYKKSPLCGVECIFNSHGFLQSDIDHASGSILLFLSLIR